MLTEFDFLDFLRIFEVERLLSPYRKRPRCFRINVAYKTKDKKVQLVDKADRIGNTPRGRRD